MIVRHSGACETISGRLDAIEWVRVLAAGGVIWFHIKEGPYKEAGHAGLICFVLISVVFQAAGPEKEGLGVYLRKKTSRVLTPWLFWFAFYGLFNLGKGRTFLPGSENIIEGVLSGPWVGLWYLPFILIISPVVYALSKWSAGWRPLTGGTLFLVIGLLFLFFSPQLSGPWKGREPWGQWVHALPAVPLGLAMHALLKTKGALRVAAMLTFLLVVELVCGHLLVIDLCTAIPYAVAVLVTGPGFLIRRRLPEVVTRLGGLCLGVYLIHSAVITFLRTLPAFRETPFLLWLATVLVSFALTALLRGHRLSARVL